MKLFNTCQYDFDHAKVTLSHWPSTFLILESSVSEEVYASINVFTLNSSSDIFASFTARIWRHVEHLNYINHFYPRSCYFFEKFFPQFQTIKIIEMVLKKNKGWFHLIKRQNKNIFVHLCYENDKAIYKRVKKV